MARIAGVDLPKRKHMEIALTYIHGIGRTSARKILDQAELPYNTNSDDLTDGDVAKIRTIIEDAHMVEGDRRRLRHRKGMPCRGQRTSTNARTRKGPRRGSGIKRK